VPMAMSQPVFSMGGGRLHLRLRQLLPRFLKPPLIAGGIHDVCRTAASEARRA
jgi:hypothetical protein